MVVRWHGGTAALQCSKELPHLQSSWTAGGNNAGLAGFTPKQWSRLGPEYKIYFVSRVPRRHIVTRSQAQRMYAEHSNPQEYSFTVNRSTVNPCLHCALNVSGPTPSPQSAGSILHEWHLMGRAWHRSFRHWVQKQFRVWAV